MGFVGPAVVSLSAPTALLATVGDQGREGNTPRLLAAVIMKGCRMETGRNGKIGRQGWNRDIY